MDDPLLVYARSVLIEAYIAVTDQNSFVGAFGDYGLAWQNTPKGGQVYPVTIEPITPNEEIDYGCIPRLTPVTESAHRAP